MKVLHVMGRMPPHGAQRQIVRMLQAAHQHYWNATLCVLHSGYSLTRDVMKSGIPVVETEDAGRLDVRRAVTLRRLIRRGDFDVVHSSLWGCNAFTRLAAAGPTRPRIVISELSVENWRPRYRRAIDRALKPLTDVYVGNSQDVRDFICRAHGVPAHRVFVIRNGLDRDIFKPGPPKLPNNGPALIGCLGRLIPDKGFQIVIQSLPSILRSRDVRLLIAGEGDYRASLEEAAKGLPVELCGLLPTHEDVAAFLHKLDLFIMPSRYEGLPNAVLEALGCGVPVVATAVPGMEEATGDHAILVPPDDPDALARAILAALEDPPKRPSNWAVPTFDEVAIGHLHVFEAALRSDAKHSEIGS